MIYSLSHQPGRWMFWDGSAFLYFSGTSYLGLANDPVFHEKLTASISQYGSNFGSSRIGSMRLDIYDKTEQMLAGYLQQEKALTVSSGTLAGILAYRVFDSKGELIFAPNAHPALWLQIPARFKSREDWEETCLTKSYQSGPPLFIYSNAIDSLQVIPYNFNWLHQLGDKREIILVLDESHTLGIRGKDGTGVLPSLTMPGHIQGVMIGSMGKAMGIPAGLIAGNTHWINEIWQSPHFGGASPASPAYLETWTQLQSHYTSLRKILKQNMVQFEQLTGETNPLLRSIPGYPVHFSKSPTLADHLFKNKIFVSHFPYPTTKDEPITRIVLSSLHQEEDIRLLADTLSGEQTKPPFAPNF
jgi:7-keto-8-aminopelargonate synthetase-like enzyme